MKARLAALALFQMLALTPLHANPEIAQAVAASFGDAVAANILLLKGTGTTGEPVEWTAYTRDPFRAGDILRIRVGMDGPLWRAEAAGAGGNVLNRVPSQAIDFSRQRIRSAEARMVAAKAAALAQATFAQVDYQLASNTNTGAPEWGLALRDDSGYEVGFCVVSAETGALTFQDWTPRFQTGTAAAGEDVDGERAARAVKKGVRKAWEWGDAARKETRSFFKELFR